MAKRLLERADGAVPSETSTSRSSITKHSTTSKAVDVGRSDSIGRSIVGAEKGVVEAASIGIGCAV